MIDILVPVLGRPQNVQPLVESIQQTTEVEYEIWFLCSRGDKEEIEAAWSSEAHHVVICDWEPGYADYPRKMNHGYQLSEQPFLLMGADDLTFFPGWDEKVLRVAEVTGAGVIGTNDHANRSVMKGRTSTHPLVRRSYLDEQGGTIDGPGTFISEAYDHNFCERELNGLAMARRQWAFAKQSKIVHRHPCWGTAPPDSTYDKGIERFFEDQVLFYTRAKLWGSVGVTPQEMMYARQMKRRKLRYTRPR
jgi:hypothetical protein